MSDHSPPVASQPSARAKAKGPTLGAGDKLGEGDTSLVLDVLPPELGDVAFERLRKEVKWNVMLHRGPFTNPLAPAPPHIPTPSFLIYDSPRVNL
jgi:hypothetical protein